MTSSIEHALEIPSPKRNYQVNSIINGDCLEVLSHIKGEAVDLVAFSPPYDTIRDYKREWRFDYTALGRALYRVMKDGGICAVVIGDGTKDFAKSLTTARLTVDWCDNAGWRLFEQCIYFRDGNPGAWWNQRFRVDHEYILLFLNGKRQGPTLAQGPGRCPPRRTEGNGLPSRSHHNFQKKRPHRQRDTR